MEMYKARYFALDANGDEVFAKDRYFSSKMKALDWLRMITSEEMQKDADSRINARLYGCCDYYTQLTRYYESEGVFAYAESAVYSYIVRDEPFKCFEGTKPLLTSL